MSEKEPGGEINADDDEWEGLTLLTIAEKTEERITIMFSAKHVQMHESINADGYFFFVSAHCCTTVVYMAQCNMHMIIFLFLTKKKQRFRQFIRGNKKVKSKLCSIVCICLSILMVMRTHTLSMCSCLINSTFDIKYIDEIWPRQWERAQYNRLGYNVFNRNLFDDGKHSVRLLIFFFFPFLAYRPTDVECDLPTVVSTHSAHIRKVVRLFDGR